jgi:hypothetical protein
MGKGVTAVDSIVGIVMGFALTTGVGGWWASRLQARSWAKQNDVWLQEQDRERAGAACQDLMSLLDRRLYRMQRLLWVATAAPDESTDDDELERRRKEHV